MRYGQIFFLGLLLFACAYGLKSMTQPPRGGREDAKKITPSKSDQAALPQNRSVAGMTGPTAPGAGQTGRFGTPNGAPGKTLPGKNARKLEDFLNDKAPGNWNILRSEDGSVNGIMGGLIPDAGRKESTALALAREIVPLLGVDPAQLRSKGIPESTPLTTAYRYEQTYEGFDVWASAFSIHARKSDGSVFIINNSLKVIDKPNLNPSLTAAEAQRIVEAKFADRSAKVTLKTPNRVLWAETSPQELAWVFLAEFNKPEFQKYEVIVGAESERILYEASVLLH